MAEFKELEGNTFDRVAHVADIDDERIVFERAVGSDFFLYHSQECCESVYVEDIEGDLHDLEDTPILFAEESSTDIPPDGCTAHDDSNQWTFYRIRTIKGSVVIRWYGSSNGYYSTSVSFAEN